jgi:Domain of unknown function (DUF5664)
MNRKFSTGAQRDTDEGKPRMSLIPTEEFIRVMNHYRKGGEKYGFDNWKHGMTTSVFYDSAQRHLLKWWAGEEDEDHLSAVVWNVMGAMWTQKNKPELDDRENFK